MSINKFSKFVQQDIQNSRADEIEEYVEIVADNFFDIAFTGDLKQDVDLVVSREGGRPSGGLLPLRLKNGRLVSAFTLRNLLTVKMQQIAKSKMGKNGRLRYQTGRLLRSAIVEPQIVNENNVVSLRFRYMFAPYEVFDPKADVVTDGGFMKRRLATIQRSPRKLFRESLREAAKEILYRGYDIRVAQVGVRKR